MPPEGTADCKCRKPVDGWYHDRVAPMRHHPQARQASDARLTRMDRMQFDDPTACDRALEADAEVEALRSTGGAHCAAEPGRVRRGGQIDRAQHYRQLIEPAGQRRNRHMTSGLFYRRSPRRLKRSAQVASANQLTTTSMTRHCATTDGLTSINKCDFRGASRVARSRPSAEIRRFGGRHRHRHDVVDWHPIVGFIALPAFR